LGLQIKQTKNGQKSKLFGAGPQTFCKKRGLTAMSQKKNKKIL